MLVAGRLRDDLVTLATGRALATAFAGLGLVALAATRARIGFASGLRVAVLAGLAEAADLLRFVVDMDSPRSFMRGYHRRCLVHRPVGENQPSHRSRYRNAQCMSTNLEPAAASQSCDPLRTLIKSIATRTAQGPSTANLRAIRVLDRLAMQKQTLSSVGHCR